MAYKPLKFEIKKTGEETVYVAVVEKEGEEQPFRMRLEHFETKEEAMDQVKAWIATQEEDDARGAETLKKERLEAQQEGIIDELNKDL